MAVYTYSNTFVDGNTAYASEVKTEFQAVETAFTKVNITSVTFTSASSTITLTYEDGSTDTVGLASLNGTENGADEGYAYFLGTM